MRERNPNQALATGPAKQATSRSGEKRVMDEDEESLGLKPEPNLGIEIELKASIRGDFTSALLYVVFDSYRCWI